MAASRKQINGVFALIVAGLIMATILFAIRYEEPVIPSSGSNVTTGAALPENHPPVDVAQKLTELIRMSEEDPQDADIHSQIGNIYYDMGDYDQAIVSYRQSLNILPNQPYVETDMATCFHYLGQDDEALKLLDNVLQYSPGFIQALYNKGVVLIHGKNDLENGIQAWEKLLQLDLDPARRAELEQNIEQLKSSAR